MIDMESKWEGLTKNEPLCIVQFVIGFVTASIEVVQQVREICGGRTRVRQWRSRQ